MLKNCDNIPDKLRSEISIEYVKCRVEKMGGTLPNACYRTWTWTRCDKAIHAEDPSSWTTYDNFYYGIGAVCFAHTFDKKQEQIQQEIIRMHETGRDITDGIHNLMNDLMDIRKEHADYFQSIDANIRNTSDIVVSVASEVSTIRDISNQVLGDMENISKDTLYIRSGVGDAAVELSTMLGVMGELQKAFEIVERSRPFLTFVNDTFVVLWHLWGVFSSLWHSFLNRFQNFYYGYTIASLSLFMMVWIWWYHFQGFLLKLFPIIILGTFDQISFDAFKRVSPFIIITS